MNMEFTAAVKVNSPDIASRKAAINIETPMFTFSFVSIPIKISTQESIIRLSIKVL